MPLRPPVLLAAAGCVLLALAASASASTRSKSVTLTEQGQRATLKPRCPEGQRATGGGFNSVPADTDPHGRFFESRKAGQRAWRVKVFQTGDDGPLPVTAFVYCDPDAPRTTTKSKAIEIPAASGFGSATARCGSAGRAQAGGFRAPVVADNSANPYGDILESFRTSRKGWRSTAVVYGAAGSSTLTSYAYCADAPLPKARSGSTLTQDSVDTARSRRCKPDTHVAAGGFSQPDADLDDGYFFLPYQLRRAGRRWRASAEQFGPALATTLTATAYCVA